MQHIKLYIYKKKSFVAEKCGVIESHLLPDIVNLFVIKFLWMNIHLILNNLQETRYAHNTRYWIIKAMLYDISKMWLHCWTQIIRIVSNVT